MKNYIIHDYMKEAIADAINRKKPLFNGGPFLQYIFCLCGGDGRSKKYYDKSITSTGGRHQASKEKVNKNVG